jgi:hypothetical protein
VTDRVRAGSLLRKGHEGSPKDGNGLVIASGESPNRHCSAVS